MMTCMWRDFPIPNERELLANMKRYLKLRREGWYGANHYHIILALDGDRTVAASVSDYLATPNCGVIEFLLVAELLWGTGIGKSFMPPPLKRSMATRAIGRDGVDGIVIELNDPFRVAARDDNYDPFERALIWDGGAMAGCAFPMCNPLSPRSRNP